MKTRLSALAAIVVIGAVATATPARAECWFNGFIWQCGHYYYPYTYYYHGSYFYYPRAWRYHYGHPVARHYGHSFARGVHYGRHHPR